MTTDITELAQSMRTAAEKLGAAQWQTRNVFSGTEVIVKGSLEKGTGCVSFQPVAADIADTKTARAIALFSPANVLALVEALEKAQRANAAQDDHINQQQDRIESLEKKNAELGKYAGELESRTVKLPKPKNSDPGWKIDPEFINKVQGAIGYDDTCECWEGTPSMEVVEAVLLAAAGIKVEAE